MQSELLHCSILWLNQSDKSDEKKVAFADDITTAGRVDGLRKLWDELSTVGSPFGYFPKPSWCIVKPERYDEIDTFRFAKSNKYGLPYSYFLSFRYPDLAQKTN